MGATIRMVMFAQAISNLLDIPMPDTDNFEETQAFISENVEDFYSKRDEVERQRRKANEFVKQYDKDGKEINVQWKRVSRNVDNCLKRLMKGATLEEVNSFDLKALTNELWKKYYWNSQRRIKYFDDKKVTNKEAKEMIMKEFDYRRVYNAVGTIFDIKGVYDTIDIDFPPMNTLKIQFKSNCDRLYEEFEPRRKSMYIDLEMKKFKYYITDFTTGAIQKNTYKIESFDGNTVGARIKVVNELDRFELANKLWEEKFYNNSTRLKYVDGKEIDQKNIVRWLAREIDYDIVKAIPKRIMGITMANVSGLVLNPDDKRFKDIKIVYKQTYDRLIDEYKRVVDAHNDTDFSTERDKLDNKKSNKRNFDKYKEIL